MLTAFNPITCLYLLVLLIFTSQLLVAEKDETGDESPSAPPLTECTAMFKWNPNNPAELASCVTANNSLFSCEPRRCIFAFKPLTPGNNFVFHSCWWVDYSSKKNITRDVYVKEMYDWSPQEKACVAKYLLNFSSSTGITISAVIYRFVSFHS